MTQAGESLLGKPEVMSSSSGPTKKKKKHTKKPYNHKKKKKKKKPQTINFLGDSKGENLDDFGFGNEFLYVTLNARSMKEIIDRLGFIKVKITFFAKDTIKKAVDWGKIFAKHISDKGPVFKIYNS
jgi:hypothetical protein